MTADRECNGCGEIESDALAPFEDCPHCDTLYCPECKASRREGCCVETERRIAHRWTP